MRKTPKSMADRLILALGIALVLGLLVVPLILIFSKALGDGLPALWSNLQEDYMLHAIGLTLFVAVLTVPLNMVFGILLAWCLTHYEFRGRRLLSTLVDLPYAVSPVVAGLCYLVVYGVESSLGQWLSARDIQRMFAWPGILMVTIFVATPYAARILIRTVKPNGSDARGAARSLGASGGQSFWDVTLPVIKWVLLYGVVLSNDRAIAEFGAVAVVSGSIMIQTLTLSVRVDQLTDDN